MTTTLSPQKSARAQAIETCIRMAAEHFDANPVKVFTNQQVRCKKQRMARAAVWFHLYRSGMSAGRIGKVWFGKSADCVIGEHGMALKSKFTDADWEMIEKMPEIPNTLKIEEVTA